MAKTVIIIDDEEDIIKFVRARLTKRGYQVLVAENGQVGVDLVQQHRPALILMDKSMPVMDGVVACRQIKADPALHSIPIVLVTASSPGLTKEEVDEMALFDGYLGKPFEAADLIKKVQDLIGPGDA